MLGDVTVFEKYRAVAEVTLRVNKIAQCFIIRQLTTPIRSVSATSTSGPLIASYSVLTSMVMSSVSVASSGNPSIAQQLVTQLYTEPSTRKKAGTVIDAAIGVLSPIEFGTFITRVLQRRRKLSSGMHPSRTVCPLFIRPKRH